MRVLLLAPFYDALTPGESWSTYKWVQGISAHCETVVLTQHKRNWNAEHSPTQAKLVVNWTEPDLPGMNGRIAWELKPAYFFFYLRAKKWIRQALRRGERFDLIHQINPLGLRYPSPACGHGVPYLMGPLAGSLPTPAAFKATTPEKQWYRKFRALDNLRLRYDPWLTRSYIKAAAVIGVAPYVQDLLRHCAPARFEIMAETGVEEISSTPKQPPAQGEPLRLLFVGRLIRTKGILEAIESVALARSQCSLTFDIIGTGDLATECQQMIDRLNLGSIVRLHGRQPKEEVFRWYDRSHVFLFPSYREPSGNVVFEAMSRGLPVITSRIGGPGYVVTDACGLRISSSTRKDYIHGLTAALEALANQPHRITEMSSAAIRRIESIATWPTKIKNILKLYDSLHASGNGPRCNA